jgi:hypothetical protein
MKKDPEKEKKGPEKEKKEIGAIVIEQKETIAKEIEIMNAETKIEDIMTETIADVMKGHKKKTPISSKDEKLRRCEEPMQAKPKKWRPTCKRK